MTSFIITVKGLSHTWSYLILVLILWVHKLIGAQVVEIDGTDRGTVVSVIANPASDLLELEDGHLVPLTFVTDFDSNIVHVDAPDGLFDLS